MKQRLRTIVILVFTIILLLLVISKVGLENLIDTLSGADLRWVLLSFCLAPFIVLTGVVKWNILLKAQGIKVPFWRLYALYLVGKFFNNFLPSNVGGDVVRGYELGNYTKDGASAMASVFMERFTGLVVLVIMAVISFISHLSLVQNTRLSMAMAFAVIGLFGILWLILDSRPLDFIDRWFKFSLVQKSIPKFRKFHTSLNTYRHHKKALLLSVLWSVIFMTLAIVNVYVSASAFYSPISFMDMVVIVPVILVVSMVPLTFNGLGIQEWAYVILFTWVGLPPSVGLSAIILIRAKDLTMAIIGGFLYPTVKLSKGKLEKSTSTDRSSPDLSATRER